MPSIFTSRRRGSPSPWRGRREGLTSLSLVPWMTTVGTAIAAQARRAVAGGDDRRELAARAGRVAAAVVAAPGDVAQVVLVAVEAGRADHAVDLQDVVDVRVALLRRRAEQDAVGRELGWPDQRAPVLDMIEHSDSTARGCSIAIVWAIMPPIEAPTTCARSIPRWSSRPTASPAMSESV